MKNTVLVLGAGGTVGREVVKALQNTDARIKAAVHSHGISDPGLRVQSVVVDYEKPESVATAMEDVDTLFLLTPFTNTMVELTKMLSAAAKKAHVNYIVKLSVLGAEVLPGIALTRWHAEAEYIVQSSGISYAFLRPNTFMQNFINFMGQSIRDEGKIYVPAGEGKSSFVDARDIGAVAAKVLTSGRFERGAYPITGREALTYGQAAEIISRVSGRSIIYVDVPPVQAREGMQQSGMPAWAIDAMLELYGLVRGDNLAAVSPTVEKITGRKATTFEGFVIDHKSAFQR